jgi:hypothetical protein
MLLACVKGNEGLKIAELKTHRWAAMMRLHAILLATVLLAGCSLHPASSMAVVTRDSQNRYEIRLDATGWSGGGPCNISFVPRRYYESHWIYTTTIEGKLSTNQFILTRQRGKTEYPWDEKASGTVTFTNGRMHVALGLPYFRDDGNVSHYVPYKLNGDYSLELR